MGPLHFHRIAGVVAVQGKGGDEDRAVDADLVHCRHHLVTRGVIRPVRHIVPGSLLGVCLIGMDLGIDDGHRASSGIAAAAPVSGAFSLVPDSGISAAAFSPCCTLGTVAATSVIGRPWVGAMVLTPSRSLKWSSRSQ